MSDAGRPAASTCREALGAILRVQEFIAAGVPVQRVLQEICAEAVDILGADAAAIVTTADGVGNRAFAWRTDEGRELIDAASPASLWAIGQSASRGELDVAAPVSIRKEAGQASELIAIGTPLHAEGQALGGMFLLSASMPPDRSDVDVLKALAGHAGIALVDVKSARRVHEAMHDAITGLPGESLFHDRVEHALAAAERRGVSTGLLSIDLDVFSAVNDRVGHEAAEGVLRDVAKALTAVGRAADSAARLGGDRFGVLLEDADRNGALAGADRVAEAIAEIVELPQAGGGLGASIGVSVARPGECSREGLLQRAELAMREVKKSGRGGLRLYHPDMGGPRIDPAALTLALKESLEHGDMRVHYQPLVSLLTEEIVGVEALARWQHPEYGMLPPDEFISGAETNGLILPLGREILEAAAADVARWRREIESAARMTLSVNISAPQLKGGRLTGEIARALDATGLPAEALTLEVSESLFIGDDPSVGDRLAELRDLGAKLAIDDYGTGCSSLGYIQEYPFDILKIDRRFVRGLSENRDGAPLVQSMLTLAEQLGMRVIAEGIENAIELAQLKAMRCEIGQGFYFARPVPADRLAELLADPSQMLSAA